MEQAVIAQVQSERRPWWLGWRALVLWWLIGGAGLMFAIGAPPVQRTQEARVLESAREMPGNGWRGWMLPHLNGNLRLRKPPLAYWLAAGAYEIGGVSEGVGRVPTVLLAWLTVAITFACANWLFGRRPAFFAAGCLLTSYLFFRYTRLAETDASAMFFVTLGIFAFWKAIGQETGTQLISGGVKKRTQLFYFHVAAAATAGAILSKGPPGAYPPLFFLVMVVLTRRWKALWRFVASGAPFTLIILAAPWFIYVFHSVGVAQWLQELHELEGEDHPGHFWQYLYELFVATAPWCLLMPAAFVAALNQPRELNSISATDRIPRSRLITTLSELWNKLAGYLRARSAAWAMPIAAWFVSNVYVSPKCPQTGILIWLAVIFVPLCFVGNKQFHYLLPLMPPTMILVGWWIDRALMERRTALIDVTIVASVLAIPAVPITARLLAGRVSAADYVLASMIGVLLMCVVAIHWRVGRDLGAAAYVAAVLVVFVPIVGLWMPSLERDDARHVAREVSGQFGAGPYCFYGPNYSLPLCFYLRSTIPQVKTAGELETLTARQPRIVVIVQTKSKFAPPPLPAGFEQEMQISRPKQLFQFYQHHD